MLEKLKEDFLKVVPTVDFCSLRFVRICDESVSVRQDIPQPTHRSEDVGAMITVVSGGGLGYAATSDLSSAGLKAACDKAARWARTTANRSVVDFRKVEFSNPQGEYIGPNAQPWESTSVADKFDMLMGVSKQLKVSDAIVDWDAGLWHSDVEMLYLTVAGGEVFQRISLTGPSLRAVANAGSLTQSRTLGGHAFCGQGGLEVMERYGFADAPQQIAAEAVELLQADDCPSAVMDLLLAPDQMILQIHESIGHPLELDRILGDERNYAGTSFVTLDMLGSYRYGSELLNVVYDPTRAEQTASFGYDDEGLAAEKIHIIKGGILQRGIGGCVSQVRTGLDGVANSRADTWRRPPIDRMANLNLEPGDSTLDDMISSVERGVYMKTNCSWSIDDSRNKFQFGCEWGRLIENGKLTKVVRTPNYRGISATFWRNLKAVGNEDSLKVMGTPNCGKGEPNQIMYVGHASPPCLFADVEVFGGA